MKIIVTIPAYNEENTIGSVVTDIKRVMTELKFNYEIIVVDDGSNDDTVKIAKASGAIVYSNNSQSGLASTFRNELAKALEHKADIILHIDADGQYQAEEIPELLKPILEDNYELVLGSRFIGKIEEMPLIKKIGNRLFSRIISDITKKEITDAQTGFRAFTRRVAEQIEIVSTHTYTQEQTIKAVSRNFRFKEVPVYFAKRLSGKSRLMSSPFDYAFRAWLNLFRLFRDYSPLRFFGSVGVGLIIVAIFLSIYSILVMDRILDTTVVVLFLGGIQIILFAFLAEMIRK